MTDARDRINTAAQEAGWRISSYGVEGTGQYIHPDGYEMIAVGYSARNSVTMAYRRALIAGDAAGDETRFVGRGIAEQVIRHMVRGPDDGFAADMAEMQGLVDKVFAACEALTGETIVAALGHGVV